MWRSEVVPARVQKSPRNLCDCAIMALMKLVPAVTSATRVAAIARGRIAIIRRRIRAPAALLLALALLAAAPPASAEMVYRRGEPGDAATLDPQKTATVPEADILLVLFEGLTTYDAKGEIAPGVAQSWTISEDGLVYTFKLRDAKWSNGDKVRASDFVFSFGRLLDPATGAQYANLFYAFKNGEKINKGALKPDALGVKAIDDETLEIALEQPTPYLLGLLAHQTAVPVQRANVEKFGRDFVRPGNLVSNGAFKLQDFTPNDRTVLVRNENFHDAAKVRIDREIFYSLEDRSAALRRFQAGEIDSYSDAPAEQIPFIRQTLKDQFRLAPMLGTYYFAFNASKPPFDDARVRVALSMVVDREFLAEKIWSGAMLPAYRFTPPGIPGYEAAAAQWKDLSPIDREDQALALLKAAGYGPGGKPLHVEIRYNTSENHKNTAIALADMWKALGVETSFVNADINTHFALLQNGGDYDVARAGWIGDYADPQSFLFLAESGNKGLNYSRYSNPDFDALMRKAATERDLAARAKIMAAAEAILTRDQPIMPLLFYSSKNLISPKLKGWESNILDRHPARYLAIAP
jgi:oligopeptide transport system substrate-binding protein